MDGHARDDAVTITSAQPGRSVDLHRRQMRYLISMAIRTVCFVGAVIASGPLRWGLVVCAILLPYIAVVFANNTTGRTASTADEYRQQPVGSIESDTSNRRDAN